MEGMDMTVSRAVYPQLNSLVPLQNKRVFRRLEIAHRAGTIKNAEHYSTCQGQSTGAHKVKRTDVIAYWWAGQEGRRKYH